MTDKTKIIERIQRLLALSQSSNVNEAAAAAAKAQELMARYDIEQASLDVDCSEDNVAIGVEVLAEMGFKVTPWKSQIANALGKANGAKVYIEKGHKAQLKLVGTADQANTIRYMFAYLVKEVDRLAKENSGNGRSWLASFRLGAAAAISDRLKASAEATKEAVRYEAQTTGNANAIMRIDQGLRRIDERTSRINAYAKENLRLRSAGPRKGPTDYEGYRSGQAAGQGVRLGGGPALGKGSSGRLN